MNMKTYFVYIITNINNSVFYIGVTNNLKRRTQEHREEIIPGFSKKYKVKKLVYFEETSDVKSAIQREKQLKNWHREWKINLIKSLNPELRDLDPETSSG